MSDPVRAAGPVSGADATAETLVEQADLWGNAWKYLRRSGFFITGSILLTILVLMALVPQLFTFGKNPRDCDLYQARKGISAAHWLGTDLQGCDYYANVVYGARVSLSIGLIAMVGVLIIGVIVGALAGYFGGIADSALSRLTDVFYGIPTILGGMILLSVVGDRNVWTVAGALIAFGWMTSMRLVRSSVMTIKQSDYVQAAIALGAPTWRILLRHILPNALAPVLVYATIAVGTFIAAEATLTYMGIGLELPEISWGLQINDGQSRFASTPRLVIVPALFLSAAVLAFIMVGDALRDALDPPEALMSPVVEIEDLSVDFEVDKQWIPAVKGVSLTVAKGEVLAIVGESGSGKSTTAMAVPALLPPSARVRGSIKLNGAELLGATNDELRAVRGKDVAVIFQEPMTALNPVYTIGWQIAEAVRAHGKATRTQARARAIELLELVDMPEPEKRVKHYPHQLSGGQRQRAMIAQALALDPGLLIADEPTTALDVTVQAEILDLMRDLRHRIEAGIILITHDMGVVADMADRIMVMKDGAVVEEGDADSIFHRATQPYTRQLLAAVPHLGATLGDSDESPQPATDLALSVEHAVIEYPGKGGAFRAIDDVSFAVGRGEVVGLVGESGSGKSTIGRAAVGLLKVTSGKICVAGHDISMANRKQLREIRSKVGVVFQDPGSSLNPRWPIGQSIAEPLSLHTEMDRGQREGRVKTLLEQVQLPANMRNRFPHQLSGGQRQRVGIARALALEPTLLIADEPTSALDVSVQARVLELFGELQREYGFACLFISHDLAVVELVASRIAVLNHGRLAEFGSDQQVLTAPTDDYTKRLLAAVPVPDPEQQRIRREERKALQ